MRACETTWQQTRNDEPWRSLRYKEYGNPVLILAHLLQTRLCCRIIENLVVKENGTSWAAWPQAGLPPVRGKSTEVQGSGIQNVGTGRGFPGPPVLALGATAVQKGGGPGWGGPPIEALRATEPTAPGDVAVLSFLLSRRHHQSHGHWEVVGQACQLGDKNELFHLLWGQRHLSDPECI